MKIVIEIDQIGFVGPAEGRLMNLLREFGEKLHRDQQHYGDGNYGDLGVKGQFVEINGKINPLRRVLWEGHAPVREGPREMLLDLIGHCFLAIDILDQSLEGVVLQPPVRAADVQAAWDAARGALVADPVQDPPDTGWNGGL